jgi:hypothetical protein
VVIQVKGNNSDTIKTTGEGDAWIFKNGSVQKVRWQKTGNKDRLKFVDETGSEVPLNRGDTWISALTESRKPSF